MQSHRYVVSIYFSYFIPAAVPLQSRNTELVGSFLNKLLLFCFMFLPMWYPTPINPPATPLILQVSAQPLLSEACPLFRR